MLLTLVALSTFAFVPAQQAKALERLDINVPGGSELLLETLRSSSLLFAQREAGRTDPVDLIAAARAEYGRLIGLLYEEAYYAPEIRIRVDGREAADISSLSTPARIDRIVIDIDLGDRFTFGAVAITPLAPDTDLPEGFAQGLPARSTVVREALAAALDGWRAQGHAHAEAVGQDVVADHGARTLNVALTIAPGPQLRVGAVIPEGNDRTRGDRVVAIAGLEPGAVHDPEALAAAERRLRQTGTFVSVNLRTEDAANPDGTVDIRAEVEEALPRRLGFGIEADSEAGVRVSGFWLHRNLLGGAERFRIEAAIDGIGSRLAGVGMGFTLDARYTRPATFNRDTDLELGLRAVRLNERDYDADAIEAEALLRRRINDVLSASAGVQLRYEDAEYSGTSNGFGTLGVPVVGIHDTRDDPLDASEGLYLMAEAMPYLGFGAAQHGVRLQFDGRIYQDMNTGGRVVLAARAQAGMILGSAIDAMPRGFLFYSGGGGTVRGLPYQSLGVAGPPASGGRGFAALSTELRVRINDTLSLAAFADAGRVSAAAWGGVADWHAGGGFGVRYATPIGPLRLDLATPLRRNASAVGSSDLQIYLGIGQAF